MKTYYHKSYFIKLSTKIIIIFLIILSIIIFLITWFGKFATPKLTHIANLNISKYIETVASNFKIYDLAKNNSDEFLIIKENSAGEITAIDYNMDKIYKIADTLTTKIQNSLNSSDTFTYQEDTEGIIISLPLGVISDSVFLTNLGPKIPIYIHFIDSVMTQLKTKVTDYGINNALIDVYLDITISYEIISPVKYETEKLQYSILIDSKVIQGSIPYFYGKTFESQSAFFEVSFP